MNPHRALLEWRRATARFARASIGDVVASHLRALAYHVAGPARFEPDRSGRAERVVVTLSTTPRRAAHLLPTLRSLLAQTVAADRIVLALPRSSRRDGSPYPAAADLGLPAGVEVLDCVDEGPATKLLPALAAEPAARLVVVDDDVVYPADFLATLLAAHRAAPAAVVGYRGVRLEAGVDFADATHLFATAVAAPTAVDVLFGTWGYLVPPGALDATVGDFSAAPDAVRNVDDIWISGHLARRGVPRMVVPARSYPIETIATLMGSLTGGVNRSGDNDRLAIALFAEAWGGDRRNHTEDGEC